MNGLSVNLNSGGGNCFFIAIADAINYNNYKNPENKVTSGPYGKGNLSFTQTYLRSLVSKFILGLSDLDTYLNAASVNSENLNMQFEQQVTTLVNENNGADLTNEEYLQVANDIYTNSDNFLVKSPTSVPIDISNYYKPFTIIDTKPEIEKYIMSSSYWANDLAINVINMELKLNILPIENENGTLIIRYGNFLTTHYNDWDKYLFLYKESNHFELISFNIFNKTFTNQKRNKLIVKKICIFSRGDFFENIPPLYIIFLIYVNLYKNLKEEDKNIFTLLKPFMKSIDESLNKILETSDNPECENFIKIYNEKFPYNPPLVSLANPIIHGGLNRRPYLAQKMIKREENIDTSKIAYCITVYMELHPGTSIKPEELKKLQCDGKWNSVKKAWSDFTGTPYVIKPAYQKLQNTKESGNRNANNSYNKNYNKNQGKNTRRFVPVNTKNRTFKNNYKK